MPAQLNLIDIAPSFTGTLMGLCNGFSATSGFFVPMVTTAFTSDDPSDPVGWSKVFFLGTALYCLAVTFFWFFGSASPQAFERASGDGNVLSREEAGPALGDEEDRLLESNSDADEILSEDEIKTV